MPTYEYACGACGHEWEVVQRITEAPVETCPACAQKEAHRQISKGTNFILKGGGWYSDLYASPKDTAKDKAAAPASGDGKAETKTDAKTETKAETKTETKSEAKAASAPESPSRPTPPAASS